MGSEASVMKEKVKLLVGVIALQLCMAGFHIVSRAALDIGISQLVFIIYRNCIALVLLAPFAYFLEKEQRPPLTFSLMVQFFLLAILGILANQGFYLLGLYYLSPTYASAIQNAIPAITFAMAAALRLEEVDMKRRYGVAKVVGTVVSIVGATVITLYKGMPLLSQQLPVNNTLQQQQQQHFPIINILSSSHILNWTLGCVYILTHITSWSAWIVLQVPVLKKYPARLSVLTLTIFFGLVQFLAIAAFTETDIDKWKIHSGMELFTILYAGLVASGLALSLQIWCIDKGGPLFASVFQPVQTVAVAIMAALILGDELYTGGIIGAVFIIIGLYSVLWGKSEEIKARKEPENEQNDLTRHLLSNQETLNKEHGSVPVVDIA